MIYTNVSNLCKSHGISIAKLEKELNFGNATVRGWISSSPTIEKLKAVADYFGVTVDSLLSDDDTPKATKSGQ